jgi:hypothetical protein
MWSEVWVGCWVKGIRDVESWKHGEKGMEEQEMRQKRQKNIIERVYIKMKRREKKKNVGKSGKDRVV